MKHLDLSTKMIKTINFNNEHQALVIKFKDHIKTPQHVSIPISVIEDYLESKWHEDAIASVEPMPSHLEVVHSNFKVTYA